MGALVLAVETDALQRAFARARLEEHAIARGAEVRRRAAPRDPLGSTARDIELPESGFSGPECAAQVAAADLAVHDMLAVRRVDRLHVVPLLRRQLPPSLAVDANLADGAELRIVPGHVQDLGTVTRKRRVVLEAILITRQPPRLAAAKLSPLPRALTRYLYCRYVLPL